MSSLKKLAAAALLSAIMITPVFAQAAIQEPGAFAFYYPNADVLNGGAPTPAASLTPSQLYRANAYDAMAGLAAPPASSVIVPTTTRQARSLARVDGVAASDVGTGLLERP